MEEAKANGTELTPQALKSIRMTAQRNAAGRAWGSEDEAFRERVKAEAAAVKELQDEQLTKLMDQAQSAEEYDQYVLAPRYPTQFVC